MKRKRAIMAIVLCMLIVGAFVILNTYSLWQVTIKQNDENTIISSCIDIEYEDQSQGIENLTAYPVSDTEGVDGDGYRFKVINKCSEPITYIVSLESLKVSGEPSYMPYSNIKLRIDNNKVLIYSDLDDIDNDNNSIRDIKKVITRTVLGNSYNEHELKIWLDKDTSVADVNKVFESRIGITGGQGITGVDEQVVYTPDNCFTVTEDGVLTSYKYSYDHSTECYGDLIIPPEVNGIVIKEISSAMIKNPEDKLDISNMYGLEKIDDCAFGMESTDPNAFKCTSVFYGVGQDLVMPDNLKSIGIGAFLGFKGNAIVLNDKLENIEEGAFLHYTGDNQPLLVPDSVKSIGIGAFQDYVGPSLTLSANLKYIGMSAFGRYNGDHLILPPKLEYIGNLAFSGYDGADITIFGAIKEIGESAFYHMGQGKTITIKKANSDGIILPSNEAWHGQATVVYDPS